LRLGQSVDFLGGQIQVQAEDFLAKDFLELAPTIPQIQAANFSFSL
jgi:hypothetical protein